MAKNNDLKDGEDPRGHPNGIPHVFTEAGSHIAHRRGYADGRIIEQGEAVPAGIAFADEWMVEAASEEEAPAE